MATSSLLDDKVASTAAARDTIRVSLLAEGDVDVPVTAPRTVASLLEELGLEGRSRHTYVDGRAAGSDSIVSPGSSVELLPFIRGG